jgi:hypothetical protein
MSENNNPLIQKLVFDPKTEKIEFVLYQIISTKDRSSIPIEIKEIKNILFRKSSNSYYWVEMLICLSKKDDSIESIISPKFRRFTLPDGQDINFFLEKEKIPSKILKTKEI